MLSALAAPFVDVPLPFFTRTLRVLVACEFSGTVREAFRAAGHEAWSCDLLPTDRPSDFHHVGDVREILGEGWDLMIAHPPCTDLAISGRRWFAQKQPEQAEAIAFVRDLMAAPIPRIAVENPLSVIASKIRPSDQTIQPWMFGHGETKATCLWLKNLPHLRPTAYVAGRVNRVANLGESADRWRLRSLTYPGIAQAMADQWGTL